MRETLGQGVMVGLRRGLGGVIGLGGAVALGLGVRGWERSISTTAVVPSLALYNRGATRQ